MPAWIDFKELRQKLDFAAVLKHYGIQINAKSDQHTGVCPLPTDGARHRGFSAHLGKNIWQCFTCHARGNILELAVLLDGKDPENPDDFKQVALELKERFLPEEMPSSATSYEKISKRTPPRATPPKKPTETQPVVVNAPLDFALKRLDAKHPSLKQLGLTPETIERFGLGYCSHGYLAGRIAVPLKDGNVLVGYCGVAVDELEPRFLFPTDRERNGVRHRFDRTRLVYGADRIEYDIPRLLIVEDIASVWRLHELGFATVSLLGNQFSPIQAEAIGRLLEPDAHLWVISPQEEFALSVFRTLGTSFPVGWMKSDKELSRQFGT